MKKMFSSTCRILATVGLLAGATVGLSACNTVNGMGKDAAAVGHDVSKGAGATQQAVTGNTGLATH
jgi:predicted small secreted protein